MKRAGFFLLTLLAGAVHLEAREPYEAKPAVIVPGGLIMFISSQGPLSYEAINRRDLPKDAVDTGPVETSGCQYSLSIPLSLSVSGTSISGAAGNGTFRKALERLHTSQPDVRGIYDVKIDLHHTRVLGIFGRLCTEINARGFK